MIIYVPFSLGSPLRNLPRVEAFPLPIHNPPPRWVGNTKLFFLAAFGQLSLKLFHELPEFLRILLIIIASPVLSNFHYKLLIMIIATSTHTHILSLMIVLILSKLQIKSNPYLFMSRQDHFFAVCIFWWFDLFIISAGSDWVIQIKNNKK